MLQFTNYKKSYHQNLVLTIDHLELNTAIYHLKGENGSGKSTLLETIAGIIPFEGDISVNGDDSIKRNPIAFRRIINFAEAEPSFPEFLSGLDLINLFVKGKKAPTGQAEQLIEKINIGDFMDHPIANYSSGMIKKLSLVLAFIGNPKWILLDEPLNTLDRTSRELLFRLIRQYHTQFNTGFLISSHQDLDEAMMTTHRTISIDDHHLIIHAHEPKGL